MRGQVDQVGARRALGAVALLVLLALPTSAVAGPPTHLPLSDPISGYPLDHACGAAVDSQGDIYVANQGEARVEIFDPSGTHLASLSEANEPCALAVDSTGRLYVSEQATGYVVRFTPSTYPFAGTPTYGTAEPIDASGNAKGIVVDPTDDSLYVAEGSRVAMFNSSGTPGINEVQRVRASNEGGTYKLCFESQCTTPLPYNATHGEVQAALEALSTIGVGNVSVTQWVETANPRDHRIAFTGSLAGTDVEQLSCDDTGLLGSFPECLVETRLKGSNGLIGEGEVTGATGVAAYTYSPGPGAGRRYISVAESGADLIKLFVGKFQGGASQTESFLPATVEPLGVIDGSTTPAGELGLSAEAYLGVDGSSGHIFAFDASNHVVDEFEATGQYFTRIEDAALKDAEPTAIAVGRSDATNDGDVYVSVGPATGAKLLAFGPLAPAGRASLSKLSRAFTEACGTAVDSHGDLFVAGTTKISIFGPGGNELTSVPDSLHPCALAVDSEGDLYTVEYNNPTNAGDEFVTLRKPNIYPFTGAPIYGPPQTVEQPEEGKTKLFPVAITVDPSNDHVFISHWEDHGVREYESAKNGSDLIASAFCGLSGTLGGIDVYGTNNDVYVVDQGQTIIDVCDATGTRVLTRIDGTGSPGGVFGPAELNGAGIAVDQSNGHVLVGEMASRGVVGEYESSGAFVAQFGPFQKTGPGHLNDLAVDNSGGLDEGNLYVAYDAPTGFDLSAFGPLSYGEPPTAQTGTAGGVSGTTATLHGTVDPNGFDVEECRFEYLLDSKYQENLEEEKPAFEGASDEACAENEAEIGAGEEPIAVHADLAGLQAEGRYRYRLVAENEYGPSQGEAGLFGPPVITERGAQPILYREATLRGEIDPAGLKAEYHFEYLTESEYQAGGSSFVAAKSTPVKFLAAGSGAVEVQALLVGLEEGTAYRFRLLVTSEDASAASEAERFTTLEKHPSLQCPNATLRLENNSTNLPDCRAYELATPADVGGVPHAEEGAVFNSWLVTPSGPSEGGILTFFLRNTSLPGTEGTGQREAFRATRSTAGWSSTGFSPTYGQKGVHTSGPYLGTAADQLYSFWELGDVEPVGAFPPGKYLRVPGVANSSCVPAGVETGGHFETIGCGSLGEDLKAGPDYISAGGGHTIFSSLQHLESLAAPKGTQALYDRMAGSPEANVVSLKPGEVPFGADEGATYDGATADGISVAFSVGGGLYLRRNGTETVQITSGPASFAGISEDGNRVFYTDNNDATAAAKLWVCRLDVGPCSTDAAEIATNARFVNVSADGSHAYYVSLGNLYAWSDQGTKSIAALDPGDFTGSEPTPFPGTATSNGEYVGLDSWTAHCAVNPGTAELGRAFCPSRTTPSGRFLIFQSHADLTDYEAQGHSEIYRYDAEDGSLLCVSCDPSGVPATAEADLQAVRWPEPRSTIMSTALIPGATEDGGKVFFQTTAALLPEDANTALDVYEWQAMDVGGCERQGGCLALISSGQGDRASTIYAETPDGRNVFFSTTQKLVGTDIAGSPSIYDARIDGGFAQPSVKEACHGDACQPPPELAPNRSTITTNVPNVGNVTKGTRVHCTKGRRSITKNGKTRCVRRHGNRHKKHTRHERKAGP